MSSATQDARFTIQRYHMVESQLRDRGIADERVLGAMLRVPRHVFVPEPYREQAYEDRPLPIGEGQTISQPYIVALMLEALELIPENKVLEVGTGSGYVTALLAEITGQVFSVERHKTLADEARKLLTALGYKDVKVIVGDGSLGFTVFAPYDAIIVSAAAAELPPALLSQLGEGGRMIIPVGPSDCQQLQRVHVEAGRPVVMRRESCRFVPLITEVGGWKN
jgi:protein-L-isoaspartate(D-aspartate) O-methyltransferase